MIIAYFITCFTATAGIYFGVLLALFLSCNIVLKLPLITHAGILPLLALLLLPVMALFALPLATSMAVQSTIGEHRARDELVMIAFLKPALRSLRLSVLCFGLLSVGLYAFFAFYLAPQGYVLSKKLFFNAAKDQLLHVEPRVFHSPVPLLSFYVDQKQPSKQYGTIFKRLILIVRGKQQEQLFFAAECGFFDDRRLVLITGHMVSYKNKEAHTAFFKKTALHLDAYLQPSAEKKVLTQGRFLTIQQLFHAAGTQQDLSFELHKRIAQTLWQLVLVLLASVFAFYQRGSSLLRTLLSCGSAFLSTYLLIMLAQTYQDHALLSLMILYVPLVLALAASIMLLINARSVICF